MDSAAVITIVSASASGLIAALGGTYIAHRFYIKRWQLESREVYKAELFKMKLEVYRDLLRVYSVMCDETLACFFDQDGPKRFILIRKPVHYFVKSNMLVLSERAATLALKDYLEHFEAGHSLYDIAKITKSQYLTLANACREELGIDTVSAKFEKMFAVESGVKNDD